MPANFEHAAPDPTDDLFLTLSGDGEGSPFVEALSRFDCARHALDGVLSDIMHGEGESLEETTEHMTLLMVEAAQSFAAVSLTFIEDAGSDTGLAVEQIAQLITTSREERVKTWGALSDDLGFGKTDTNELRKLLESMIEVDPDEDGGGIDIADGEEEDGNDEVDILDALEQLFGVSCRVDIETLVAHAPENKNDAKRARRARITGVILRTLGDTAKIAAGATLAVVVGHYLRKQEQ